MKKQINSILFCCVLIGLSGCSKSYLDINQNPNSPTTTTPELVLPNALTVTASGQVTGFTFLEAWMGLWAPSGSYAVGNTDVSSYNLTSSTYSEGIWQGDYSNIEDYDYIEKTATAENKPFYIGAAKVMKAYVYQQLVDMFNDVPYSNALQGTQAIQPTYDKGQDIYDNLSLQLDSAITYFQSPASTAAAHTDVLFNGDNSSWIQFANTLKLRILMRQTAISGRQSNITSGIAAIKANGGGFLTSDAGVNPGYANNAGQQNPVYGYFYTLNGSSTSGGQADYWRAAKYTLDFCLSNNDPRYLYFYEPVPGSSDTYVGNSLGLTTNFSTSTSSGVAGPGVVKSVDQPAIIMTAAESYFLQAEAVLRGYMSGDVTAYYKSGVESSFQYLGATYPPVKSLTDSTKDSITFTPIQSADILVSISGNKSDNITASTTFNDKLNCIIRQKWMAMNGTTPFEAWCDYRRLGLPTNPPIPISTSPYKVINQIPGRLIYPNTEYQTNATNVGAEGTVTATSKIWWMP